MSMSLRIGLAVLLLFLAAYQGLRQIQLQKEPEMGAGRDLWTSLRDSLAQNFQTTGGTPLDPQARGLHSAFTAGAAEQFEPYLGDTLTRAGLDTVGMLNEGVAGGSELLSGRPFFSDAGFDFGDIGANYRGIEKGLRRSKDKRQGAVNPALLAMLRDVIMRQGQGQQLPSF